MGARRWVAIISTLCGLSLGVGIPLIGLSALPRSQVVDGYIVSVRDDQHALLLRESATAGDPDGHPLMLLLPRRHAVRVEPGDQPLSVLRPGDHVRVDIGFRSHWVHAITLE